MVHIDPETMKNSTLKARIALAFDFTFLKPVQCIVYIFKWKGVIGKMLIDFCMRGCKLWMIVIISYLRKWW